MTKSAKFNKTRIDIFDFHINVDNFLLDSHYTPPIEIFTEDSYATLCFNIDCYRDMGMGFSLATKGRSSVIINKLYNFYKNKPFWNQYELGLSKNNFMEKAFLNFIPISTSLIPFINLKPNNRAGFTTRLSPRVLLFPFGWSTWIDILVTGDHGLESLASLLKGVFTDAIFSLDSNITYQRMEDVLVDFTDKIRDDVYGGNDRCIRNLQEKFIITSVLGRSAGYLSCDALDSDTDDPFLHTIINPGNSTHGSLSQKHIFPGKKGEPSLNFLAWDKCGIFNYQNDLLNGPKENLNRLECYHGNTWKSLVLAKLQRELLEVKIQSSDKKFTAVFDTLLKNALHKLETLPIRNASLRHYLESDEVTTTIKNARLLYPKPKPEEGKT
jgi:hypothetical protein